MRRLSRLEQLMAMAIAGVKMNREQRRELAKLAGITRGGRGPETPHKKAIRALMLHRDGKCTPDQRRIFRNARKAAARRAASA